MPEDDAVINDIQRRLINLEKRIESLEIEFDSWTESEEDEEGAEA